MKWIIRESERIGSAPWLAWTVAVLLAPSSAAELALAEAPSARAAGRRERSSAGHVGRRAGLAAAGRGDGRLAARRCSTERPQPRRAMRPARSTASRTASTPSTRTRSRIRGGRSIWAKPTPLARVVVYNRLDYAPGLHNADTLIVLTSDDGRTWTKRYDNQGKHFGGISGAKPLEVTFRPGEVKARFVRLQIPSPQPIFLHLDEVEDLRRGRSGDEYRPAQAGRSEQPQHLVDVEAAPRPPAAGPVPLPTAEVLRRGRLLAADLKQAGLDTAPFERELDAVAARLAELPARSRCRRNGAGAHACTSTPAASCASWPSPIRCCSSTSCCSSSGSRSRRIPTSA